MSEKNEMTPLSTDKNQETDTGSNCTSITTESWSNAYLNEHYKIPDFLYVHLAKAKEN